MTSKIFSKKSEISAPSYLKNILSQGAEAIILKKGKIIIKDRILKSYRLPELDKRLRKQRTKAETKLLIKASEVVDCPVPEPQKEINKIIMPFVDGKKLSEHLDKFPLTKQKQICRQIGESIAKLHENNIIHGDLTTSNMILKDKKAFFIDFGLGFISQKNEDKAVDLHLLKQALEAKHFKNWKELWKSVESGYKTCSESKIILGRLKAVEKRGRYKH